MTSSRGRRALGSGCGLLMGMLLLVCAGGCHNGAEVVRSTAAYQPGTGFSRHEILVDGQTHAVWVFVPKNYRPENRYPAILFLHGLFEAGHGYDSSVSAGLGPVIAKDPDKWQFITIFPQSDGTWRGDDRDHLAMAALDFTQKQWSIDNDRVILAGLSFGGLGTWEIGSRHPERFAALVPVSGVGATDLVEHLVLLPTWAFASTNDPWVRSQDSEAMCKGITGHGGQARLTEFKGSSHDCWDKAVAESELVSWMLQQRRRTTTTYRLPDASRTVVDAR